MATRLYICRDTFAPSPNNFTPAVEGSWGADFSVVYSLVESGFEPDDASYLSRTLSTNSSAGTVVHALVYSKPLQTTHLWDTAVLLDFNIRIREELSTMNTFTLWNIGIISNDGATVHWQTSNMKDNTEASTTLCARINNAGYSAGSYTNIPGDRIFCELGWDKDGSVAGDVEMQYGYLNGDSDLSTGTDCTANNPYIDISHTVTFDPEGTTYSQGANSLMMMGVGI